jgi:hypothetical protein
MLMWFAGKLVNTKIVDNLCIELLLEFGSIWLSSLGVTTVQSWVTVLLALYLV